MNVFGVTDPSVCPRTTGELLQSRVLPTLSLVGEP